MYPVLVISIVTIVGILLGTYLWHWASTESVSELMKKDRQKKYERAKALQEKFKNNNN